jgi:BlaI family transcriptional regulator, penicillinase repressor
MKPKKSVPTDQELEILKVIWRRDQATVREVHHDLSLHRKIAYTTVLTMMGILEHKGHLTKTAGERAYVYRPARSQRHVLKAMTEEFVKRVFNGSAGPLLVHLVEGPGIGDEELKEIETLVRQRRRRP